MTPPSIADGSGPSSPVTISGDKIDRIIFLLERIEEHYNPPFWKKVLGFILTHLLTLTVLIFLAYITWQIWGLVVDLQGKVSGMKDAITQFSAGVGQQLEQVKFW